MKKATINAMLAGALALAISQPLHATQWEFSAHFGQMWGPDLKTGDNQNDLSIDDGNNFGFAIAWQDSPNGMGQIMFNAVSHDFSSSVDNHNMSIDILYGHFNGVALFRQQNYVTTVSLGLGGAYFDSDYSEQVYPSATIAIGTRYEFSDNLAFYTELRGYASLVDEDDDMFCKNDVCHAQVDDSLWVDANISIGIAYKF